MSFVLFTSAFARYILHVLDDGITCLTRSRLIFLS